MGVLGVEIDIIAFKRSVLISDIVSSNVGVFSQYLFARPNIRFLDPTMSNPITLGDAYWEHQQLQLALMWVSFAEVILPLLIIVPLLFSVMFCALKKACGVCFDMNATFDQLFNQSNEEYEKLTDQGVEITFGVSLSKAAKF
jgi:hypothetical protein